MKRATSIILMLLLCFFAYGQTEQKSDKIKIYFDHNCYAINLDYQENRQQLQRFSDLINNLTADTLSYISKIEINSYASPEGGRIYNQKLTQKRSNSIYDYLLHTLSISDSLIENQSSGTDWEGLRKLVEESDMEYRDEVLYILSNVPEETWMRVKPNDKWLTMVDSRNKKLMELNYGRVYNYMFENIYPKLRNGSVVTIFFNTRLPQEEPKEEIVEIIETPEIKLEPKVEVKVEPEAKWIKKPLFALKTNLLFDIATLVNVELEVPIGDRWSIAAEWIFPWWTFDNGKSDSKRSRTQFLNGNIEGKYWFGNRANQALMTGWFAGVYAGGGLYDFERNAKGYQGEFFIAAGIGGGYAHAINQKGTLRMEYSLGLGYLKTNYRYYEAKYGIDNKWHPTREETGAYTWIGPTQAKVSLVWLLNYKTKRGGKR